MKKLVILIILILPICFFVLSLSGQNITVNTQQQTDSCVTHVRLGISFTPLSDPVQMQFSQEHLDTLNVSMFRFAESWKLREAVQGIYNWGPLDARFNWIEQNAYSVLLTIQSDGPDWACNPALQNSLSCAFTDSVAFRYYIVDPENIIFQGRLTNVLDIQKILKYLLDTCIISELKKKYIE